MISFQGSAKFVSFSVQIITDATYSIGYVRYGQAAVAMVTITFGEFFENA